MNKGVKNWLDVEQHITEGSADDDEMSGVILELLKEVAPMDEEVKQINIEISDLTKKRDMLVFVVQQKVAMILNTVHKCVLRSETAIDEDMSIR